MSVSLGKRLLFVFKSREQTCNLSSNQYNYQYDFALQNLSIKLKVSLWNLLACFSHGYIYVDRSMVGSLQNIFVYAPNQKTKKVYPEALT